MPKSAQSINGECPQEQASSTFWNHSSLFTGLHQKHGRPVLTAKVGLLFLYYSNPDILKRARPRTLVSDS